MNTNRYINKTNCLNLYFIFFILCVLYKFIITLLEHCTTNFHWDITEWLINYQGGFVRRGLRGEIVYQLYNFFGLDPNVFIVLITVLSLFLLVIFITVGFIKKGYPIFILPFVFVLGNTFVNNDWMRVDSVLLLLFISIIYLFISKVKFYLLWTNILFIIGLLFHEIFFFFSFPILFLLISDSVRTRKKKKNVSYISSFIILLPSIFFFILTLYHKGTPELAKVIWESWKDVEFSVGNPYLITNEPLYAVEGISLSIREGFLSYTGSFLTKFDYYLYGVFMILITIVVIYFILTNVNKLNNPILKQKPKDLGNKPTISKVLLFQFASVLPLFILGVDYSRWILFWVITSFVLLIYIPESKLNIIPNIFGYVSGHVNDFLYQIFGDSKALILLLSIILGIPLFEWSVALYINSSSIYLVLSTISRIFRIILLSLGVQV